MPLSCRETAYVKNVTPQNKVVVEIERGEACHSCAGRGACEALGGKVSNIILELDNSCGATAGDLVELVMTETSLIKAGFVLYLIPALGLIGGALVFYKLAAAWGLDTDLLSIGGSLLGIVTGGFITYLLGKKMSKSARYMPSVSLVKKHVN